MKTKFIEATNGFNWGKFAVSEFTNEEWHLRSNLPGAEHERLLYGRGWDRAHLLVLDLQTGEGAIFRLGGSARADLQKHRIWVCPLFEPFLEWLYVVNGEVSVAGWLDSLPGYIELPNAPSAMYGHRRPGPSEAQ